MYNKTQYDSNGKLHGKQYSYYDNGNIETEHNYQHGKKHEKQIWYNEDKSINEITYYLNGKHVTKSQYNKHKLNIFIKNIVDIMKYNKEQYDKNGKQYYYWNNGNIMYEHIFQHGKLHGKQYSYYSNGNKHYILNYLHGNLHGKQIWYNKDNTIQNIEYYLNDKEVTKSQYNKHKLNLIKKVLS